MNRIAIAAISLILLLIIAPSQVFSKEIIINSDDQFRFARHYMVEGEYSRAIGEFERFLFFFPEDEKAPEARYLIGLCYLKGKQYQEARKALTDLFHRYSGTPVAEKALFLMGETCYRQGLSEEAGHYFKQIIEDYPRSEFRDKAFYRLGWTRLQENKWREASEAFSEVENSSPLYIHSMDLAQRALQGEDLPYKNPTTAGIMAGILPGLGHAYSNRYRDGFIALLLNGLFIWAAVESFDQNHEVLGGMITFLEAGWYAGNIYSAVNSAHKYNRKIRIDFFRSLPDNLDLDLYSGRNNRLGIALRFDF